MTKRIDVREIEGTGLAELIRDTIGATLVAGTNVAIIVDDAANTITITSSGGGGGTGSVALREATRASTDLSLAANGVWTAVDTALDLVFPGVTAGQKVLYTPNFNVGSQANNFAFDVGTVVAGSVVNRFGGGNNGCSGWVSAGGAAAQVSGGASYAVQAGDLDAGALTLRLLVRGSGATARTISATTTTPLKVSALLVA